MPRDLGWNLVGYGAVGGLGLILNSLIATLFNPGVLGVFTQTLACFIVGAQVAVLGVHWSVGKYAAQHSESEDECSALLVAALMLVLATGSMVTLAGFFASDTLGRLLESDQLTVSVQLAAPGVLLFAVNKTLLAFVNGRLWMRAYAVLQVVRAAGLVVAVLILKWTGTSGAFIGAVLTIAEGILLAVTLPIVRPTWTSSGWPRLRYWWDEHLRFGIWGTTGGILGELNTRIDVLFIGWFMSDRAVGLYGFAAMLAEGLYQVPVVVRQVYNPRLTHLVTAERFEELGRLIREGRAYTYLSMGVLCAVAAVAYPMAVTILTGDAGYLEAHMAFVILCLGLALSSGYIPFSQLFVQAGLARLNSQIIVVGVVVNCSLNALLVPWYGMVGAAIGTAVSWLTLPWLIHHHGRRQWGLFRI
jgi:O-antigen/teichoic acid export membrane protein